MSVTTRPLGDINSDIRKAGGRAGVHSQPGTRYSPEKVSAARAELAALKIERAITEAVESAPPLTPERRAALAEMLMSGVQR